MQNVQLRQLSSISGNSLLDWNRFWCPLGGQIAMENWGWDRANCGLLAEPSAYINQNCRPLEEHIVGDGGVWALCGAPGTGKSGAIWLWLETLREREPDTTILAVNPAALGMADRFQDLITYPGFEQAVSARKKAVLVIDGFDQFSAEAGPPFESLAFCLSQMADVSKLRLIIGCRSRDWDHSKTQTLRDLWPRQPKEGVVFEICQLTRRQVLTALSKRPGIQTEAFMMGLAESRSEAAAHWPFSLRSLLDSYEAMGDFSETMGQRVSRTIDTLLQAENEALKRKEAHHLPKLRQSARRLAALLIFNGSQGISPRSSSSPDVLSADEFFSTPELSGELIDTIPFTVSGESLHQICGTGLMTAIRPPSPTEPQSAMGFTHQSYAEFLAAEYVKGLELDQLRSLMTVTVPSGERVPPQLVETASWLATMHPKWFGYLLETMPEILLRSDGASYSDPEKTGLMEALLTQLSKGDTAPLEEVRLLTPAFSFEGLAACLRPFILNPNATEFARCFAIQVAGNCRLAELGEEIWKVLEHSGEAQFPRSCATGAIRKILKEATFTASTIERLKFAAHGNMGDDPDDDLKGVAIQCLVPGVFSAREIAPWLSLPKNSSYFGSYWRLLEDTLPASLTEADVEAFLEIGAATPSIFHVRDSGRRLPRTVCRLFARIKEPTVGMKTAFVGWVGRCSRNYISLPLIEREDDQEDILSTTGTKSSYVVDEEVRRTWLKLVIEEGTLSAQKSYQVLKALHLEWPPPDLGWVLHELMGATSPAHRIWWAKIASHAVVLPEQRITHLDLLLTAYDSFQELRDALNPCEEGLNIHESYYSRRRAGDALEKRHMKENAKKTKKHLTRRQWMDQSLARWRNDEEMAWLDLWRGCALREEGGTFEWGGDFVTDWKGWQSLPEAEQGEVCACARAFLIRREDIPHLSQEWRRTNWSEAAAYGIGLLAENFVDDGELLAAVGGKWPNAWIHHYMNVSDRAQAIAAILYPLNKSVFQAALRGFFDRENEADQFCRSIALLAKCWDAELSAMLCSWLSESRMKAATLRTGIEFLAVRDAPEALALIEIWLNRVSDGTVDTKSVEDVIAFCALVYTNGTLFEQAMTLLGDPANARRILCLGGFSFGDVGQGLYATLKAISKAQLGRLVVLMAHAFPERDGDEEAPGDELDTEPRTAEQLEQDPKTSVRNVTTASTVYRVSGFVMAEFSMIANPTELEELWQQLPPSRRDELQFTRSRMIKQAAQTGWSPLPPAQILKMVKQTHACLIRSNDDLLEFVKCRLKAFGEQAWTFGIKPLWNEPYGHPPTAKDEEELSNRLKIWLDHDLQFIVNREVQPVELMEKRLDLKIEIPGNPRLCVIVEVKKAENREVDTSMQQQLVDTYLVAGQQTHGIYAVALFGDKPSVLKGSSLAEKAAYLEQLRTALILPGNERVDWILLDFQHPKPQPKARKQKKARSGN